MLQLLVALADLIDLVSDCGFEAVEFGCQALDVRLEQPQQVSRGVTLDITVLLGLDWGSDWALGTDLE